MKTLSYSLLDEKTKERLFAKKKKWKDPGNHELIIQVSGIYESIMVFCNQCQKSYEFTKEEVKGLIDV